MRHRHRGTRARGLIDAGSLMVAVMGIVLLMIPHVREAAGEWRQHEIAVGQDLQIPIYRNALSGAYAEIYDPFEDAVVTFAGVVRPKPAQTMRGSTLGAVTPAPAAPSVAGPPPAMRIRIPAIGLDQAVVEGVSADALRNGPGHYPGTAFPGQSGNMVISGHRTTYTRPFYSLDDLQPGDPIFLDTPDRTYVYHVARVFVVALGNLGPLRPSSSPKLTLTTCNPPGSAIQRLVVQASPEGS